ncbi:MAG TPA: CAP domain-containing protein [Dehalococcoidia bacterium]
MRRHNFAPWKPLILASAVTLLTIIGALAAIGFLTGPGNSSPASSGATAALLERTAAPTSSPHPTSFLIKPQIAAEAVTGSDRIATPEPTPQPTPEPAPEPTVDPTVRAPAAVYPVATPVPPPPTPTPLPGGYRPDLSDQLYGLLNKVRTANGLQAVSPNDSLVASAQFYTQYIFVDGNPYQLDHWLAGGPGDRAWARGYCCSVGEVLVESEGSAPSMVDLWMSSAPHRSIILDPQYKSFGVACYGGPYVGGDGITHNPVVCSAEFGSG